MGDWRTLHLFDKTKYLHEIVPKVRALENYLTVFLNDKHLSYLKWFNTPIEEIIKKTIKLVSELDDELSCHPEMIKLSQIPNKNYENCYLHVESFIRQTQPSIEFFEYLIIETIFTYVADFNPYFVMGKRIFEGAIETREYSIARELTSKIRSQNKGSILDVIDGGIINWLSKEEVKLLYFDKDSISPSNDESFEYVIEFKELLKYASENNLGLISLRNPREYELCHLNINTNGFQNVVKNGNYKYLIIRDK
jgi:hypothetical protein